jgi:hypothetical protein
LSTDTCRSERGTAHTSSALLVALLTAAACSGGSRTIDAENRETGVAGGVGAVPAEGTDPGGAAGFVSAEGMDDAGGSETGDGSATSVVVNVRCFDYGDDQVICFGTLGADNWGVVWPGCSIALKETDPDLEPAEDPAAASCAGMPGAPDSLAGWDDVACWRRISSRFVECYGKLGDYWFEVFPDCIWASKMGYAGDPTQMSCGAASVDRGGWDELRCINLAGNPTTPVCYGRRGAYWVGPTSLAHYANGLFPTCELGQDERAVEVPPEGARCPADGGASGAGGDG